MTRIGPGGESLGPSAPKEGEPCPIPSCTVHPKPAPSREERPDLSTPDPPPLCFCPDRCEVHPDPPASTPQGQDKPFDAKRTYEDRLEEQQIRESVGALTPDPPKGEDEAALARAGDTVAEFARLHLPTFQWSPAMLSDLIGTLRAYARAEVDRATAALREELRGWKDWTMELRDKIVTLERERDEAWAAWKKRGDEIVRLSEMGWRVEREKATLERELAEARSCQDCKEYRERMERAVEERENRLISLRANMTSVEDELKQERAFCICGCPLDDHESYDEDGESCLNNAHECFRVAAAVRVYVERLEAQLAERDKRIADAKAKEHERLMLAIKEWGHGCACGFEQWFLERENAALRSRLGPTVTKKEKP